MRRFVINAQADTSRVPVAMVPFEVAKLSFQSFQRNALRLPPVRGKVKEFFSDFNQFPYQEGNSLNAACINYGLLRQQAALSRLKELESFAPR
jgi:hypothetical protein